MSLENTSEHRRYLFIPRVSEDSPLQVWLTAFMHPPSSHTFISIRVTEDQRGTYLQELRCYHPIEKSPLLCIPLFL